MYELGCLALSVAIAAYHFVKITTGSNSNHLIGKRPGIHVYICAKLGADCIVARVHAELPCGYGAVHAYFDCAVAALCPSDFPFTS